MWRDWQSTINKGEVFGVEKKMDKTMSCRKQISTEEWCKVWTEEGCTAHRTNIQMPTKKMHQAPRKIGEVVGLEKQWVVKHVKTQVTGASRKHLKEKIRLNTEATKKQLNQ